MSNYSSLFRVLSPSRVQTKFKELPASHIFKMRKALTCFVMGEFFDEFTIVVGDEITIDGTSVPIKDFTVDLLKKHIWKDISKKFEGYGIEPSELNLWKAEIPISEENDEILKNPKIEDIIQAFNLNNLRPKKLRPGNSFLDKSVFPDDYAPPQDHIHILVQPPSSPATTEPPMKKMCLWDRYPREANVIQGLSIESVRHVPVSQSEFKLVRENHLLYVDKTSWLAKLDLNSGQYFVSRPRKFGKSMFLSMIESFFLVQHKLFKDLHIYNYPPNIHVKDTIKQWSDPDLPPIPVIRLDFSELTSNKGPEVLEKELIQSLRSIGERFSVNLKYDDTIKGTTKELITSLADDEDNKYGKVVILVDEYDSPILSAFNATKESLKIADENREILKGFFEIIKSSQQKIKFCLVTGITMFANMQLFSGANQLVDLTLSDMLSGAYGFAKNEITTTFENKFLGEYSNISETMNKLKEKYNGYSWDGNVRVYNPFSVCSFFYENSLENFWIRKGKTSFLAKLVRLEHIKDIAKHEIRIKKDCIIPVSVENIQNSSELPIALFFQTGYLTIKQVNKETEYLILEIPNNEVRDSLMTELWANTFCTPVENAFKRIELFAELLKKDEILSFLKEYNNDLASIPHFESQHASKYEGYYHSHMHMLARYIGLPFRSEDASCKGRTDMWIESLRSLYFIEFKRLEAGGNVERLIEKATNQIFKGKYYASLTATPAFRSKTKYAIGCVFSTKDRIICGVGIQEFTYESNLLDKKQLEISLFID